MLKEGVDLSASLEQFLKDQKLYQQLNNKQTQLLNELQRLQEEQRQKQLAISKQQDKARKPYKKVYHSFLNKVAMFQLVVLLPILIKFNWLTYHFKRSSLFHLF